MEKSIGGMLIIFRIWGLDKGLAQFHSNSALNHIMGNKTIKVSWKDFILFYHQDTLLPGKEVLNFIFILNLIKISYKIN